MSKLIKLTAFMLIGLIFLDCEKIETRKEKYSSGKLKARWEVTVTKEGEFKNGLHEELYESGQMKSIVNYIDDSEHGLYRSYYKNGKVQAEINFIEGLMYGTYKEWYDNGKKKRFADYQDGMLHGNVTTWDSNGNIVSREKFENGICKEGDCK